MTKEEIIKGCSKGISEDINGKFYTIFDAEDLYYMVVEKASLYLHGFSNQPFIDEFKKYMYEK